MRLLNRKERWRSERLLSGNMPAAYLRNPARIDNKKPYRPRTLPPLCSPNPAATCGVTQGSRCRVESSDGEANESERCEVTITFMGVLSRLIRLPFACLLAAISTFGHLMVWLLDDDYDHAAACRVSGEWVAIVGGNTRDEIRESVPLLLQQIRELKAMTEVQS